MILKFEISILILLKSIGISNAPILFLFDKPQEDQEDAPLLAKFIALVLVFSILYAAYKLFFGLIKELLGIGTFSRFFKPNAQNKRLAFAVLGAHIIVSERDQLSEKYNFFSSYLRRYFPTILPLSNEEIMQKHLIYNDLQKADQWCSAFLDETERINLLDFLINLGFYNGSFNRRETSLIYHIGRTLQFPDSEIGAMMNMKYVHQERTRAHQQKTQNQNSNTQNSRSSSSHQKLKALKILGLPSHTTELEEVRKAYRNLARKHHPDRFHKSTEQEQKMAHERFTEINWAHDFLKENMG